MAGLFNLSGKVSIITGGGSGIGRSIAEKFAAQGSITCIIDKNAQAADETCSMITSAGGVAASFPADVSNQKEVSKTIDTILKAHTRIDILANSAGIAHVGKLESTSEADFDRIYNVNVKGIYNAMFATIPAFSKQGKGVILNVSSVAAIVGIPDRFAYSMSKGAVRMMTLSVARDYLHEGIRCNCISPARVHTPFVDGFLKANYPGKEKEMFEKLSKSQPIGRMAQPEEVANLAVYLCSDEAAFITGCDYPIDGGFVNLNN